MSNFIILLIIFGHVYADEPDNSIQPPTVVNGYVYINGIRTEPDEISLMLSDQMRYATTYNDGRYVIIFNDAEPGNTGTFLIIYSGKSWVPMETLTIQENVFIYHIDLHIEISGDNNNEPYDNGNDDKSENTNIAPLAYIDGPYYEIVDIDFELNASESFDLDGYIIKYEWDLGDGNSLNGEKIVYNYKAPGKYIIRLTVTDNKGKTDLDINIAYITDKPNNPPQKPTIIGITNGTIKTQYFFIINSTDSDNDNIQYTIEWGDGSQIITEYLSSDESIELNHSWIYPGVYKIKIYAKDEKEVLSQSIEKDFLIDSIYCNDIGYMVDYTQDGDYDLFYSNDTGEETPVKQLKNDYLIDFDNDGIWDYNFNTFNSNLTSYMETEIASRTSDENHVNYYWMFFIIILIPILLIVVFKRNKKQITKKKKIYYLKQEDKKKSKKQNTEKISNNKTLKEVEHIIDKILDNNR
jgi:hypothetical protein